MPSVHDVMSPMHPQATGLSAPAAREEDEVSRKRKLFGDIPDAKRRKFILVEDSQRGQRCRVKVSLDKVELQDMPDAHLRINAVYPRSYYARQTGSPSTAPPLPAEWDDEDDEQAGELGAARGKTMVKVPLMEGKDTEMAIPRMTKSRRATEVMLNELGARMSWQSARMFHNRPIFLAKSRKYAAHASYCTDC